MGRAAARRQVRRRPTGERPPLPHDYLGGGGAVWIVLLAALTIAVILGLTPGAAGGSWLRRTDLAILRGLERARSDVLTDLAQTVAGLGDPWVVRVLRWGSVLALIVFRRWRHLAVFVGCLVVVGWLAGSSVLLVERPPPPVEVLTGPREFSHPSFPVASLAVTFVGIGYGLAPRGRPRHLVLGGGAAVLALLGFSNTYLAVEYPTQTVAAVIAGVSVPLLAFRAFVPEAVFPVEYRRGSAAHLAIDERRQRAIREAVRDQMGLTVVDIEPFGLEASGGSTPLRIRVEGRPALFGKLYAERHLAADRWYKLARVVLYGALEDEKPFNSVRRLVEYEDYALRVMRDAGIPGAAPLGFVELTPEREYLTLMEFLDGAEPTDGGEISDQVVASGLATVRALWDAGLAHRDIKPANVLVREGRVLLIDVAFGQVRPSPWRQAVDLANMMLVLALGSSAERVHRLALERFDPEDIAEAFAATHGVTIPTQLRTMLRRRGGDLVAEFRAIAPTREPVRVQRLTFRRVLATAVAAGVLGLAVVLIVTNLDRTGLV